MEVKGIFKHPEHINEMVRKEGRATYFECFQAESMEDAMRMAQERSDGMQLPVRMVVNTLEYTFVPNPKE